MGRLGTDRMRVRASNAPLRHAGELIRRARMKYKLSSMSNNPSDRTALPVPEPVAYVRDLLRGIAAPWFLCGGWAADAWVGQQTRDHWDVDIAIFHDDQRAIFEHFTGWALIAHDPTVSDDSREPWNGRYLDPPAHIHVPKLGGPLAISTTAKHSDFEFEFLLIERSDDNWVLSPQPRVVLPPDRSMGSSIWGLPTAAPQAVLFHKGGGNLPAAQLETHRDALRRCDEDDFNELLPGLTVAQRSWLRESLAQTHPEHPWLGRLES